VEALFLRVIQSTPATDLPGAEPNPSCKNPIHGVVAALSQMDAAESRRIPKTQPNHDQARDRSNELIVTQP
jgi:hypothetical protein